MTENANGFQRKKTEAEELADLVALNERRGQAFFSDKSTPCHVHHGDTIPHMAALPPACFDLVTTSPPFPTLYAYSSLAEDIGNSEDLQGEAKLHLSFFYRQLARIVKPGRVVIIHVMQIPRMKRSGGQGLFDFRGLNIRLAQRAGLIFEYDWCLPRNPQAQAIRTKSRELQFAGLESDRAKCRGALADYLLKFVAPGENKTPIDEPGQVTRNNWINLAEAYWIGMKESDTLNVREGRGEQDTRHICPFILPVVDRCVRLFSDPDEIVFDPFNGIGSTGYVSIKLGRRYYGTETKPEYFHAALKNLERAEKVNKESERTLFDGLDSEEEEPKEQQATSDQNQPSKIQAACKAL